MGRLLNQGFKPRLRWSPQFKRWVCLSKIPEFVAMVGLTPEEAYRKWKQELNIRGLYYEVFE
jgi:hypothetical protein